MRLAMLTYTKSVMQTIVIVKPSRHTGLPVLGARFSVDAGELIEKFAIRGLDDATTVLHRGYQARLRRHA